MSDSIMSNVQTEKLNNMKVGDLRKLASSEKNMSSIQVKNLNKKELINLLSN